MTEISKTENYLTTRERKVVAISIAVSLAMALTAVIWEIGLQTASRRPQIGRGKPQIAVVQGEMNQSSSSQTLSTAKAPIDPVKLMPREVKGFTVSGVQRVRGEIKNAAEALFKPEEAQDIAPRPHSVYVRISYEGSEQAALNAIGELMNSRGVKERISYMVNGMPTTAGRNEDRSSFIVAWTKAGYVIEIDSGYTREVPVSEGGELEKSARAIAEAVAGGFMRGE